MNRYKLKEKCVELAMSKGVKASIHLKDHVAAGRVFKAYGLRKPKGRSIIIKIIREFLSLDDLSKEGLQYATQSVYSSVHSEMPRKIQEHKKTLIAASDPHVLTICNLPSSKFYQTPEWRQARYEAFTRYGNNCSCCGASPSNGKVLHVDHIKPRSCYPEYALDINNLQILCVDCNIGKSNIDESVWRGIESK